MKPASGHGEGSGDNIAEMSLNELNHRLTRAEALYRAGQTARVVAELEGAESASTAGEAFVRAAILRGMAQFDMGSVVDSIRTLGKAVEMSHNVSPDLQFEAAFALFVRQSDFQGPSQVLRELSHLRQLAAAAGATHSLTGLYLAVARLEGHRGLCVDARRHLEIARQFAAKHSPPSTICSIDLVDAGLESVAGNLARSRFVAEKCYAAAASLGYVKYRIGAAATLGVVSLYAGQSIKARKLIEEVLKAADGLTYIRIGALDTLLQAELRDSKLASAKDFAAQVQTLISKDHLPARSWYDLAHQVTRCTYHELRNDWDAIVAIVNDADPELARRQFKAIRTALLGAKARALAHLGRHEEADRALAVAVRACPRGAVDPLIGLEASKAVCATLRGDTAKGALLFDRALAACQAIGHRYHEWWIDRARSAVAPAARVPTPRARDITDTALLLTDVATILGAGHSIDLLAHRVAAILQSTTLGSRVHIVSEAGLPYDPTPSTSSDTNDDGTFRIRMRGSDRRFLISVTGVHAIDEISLLKSVADLVQGAVNRTADTETDDEEQNLWPRTLMQSGEDTVFRSPRMIELLRIAARLAETSLPVLITGETGTGKEVFANLIHQHSKAKRGPFVAFNCSAMARDLVESQLFGHRRGAFTGATDASPGVVRAAEGGTLFLDEIGDLDLAVQPKLLRFLESGEILPVGESRPQKVNVRIIAATNADLDERVEHGRFRSDLLYRIDVARIALPPLRERKDEIPALASLLVSRFADECGRAGLRIGDDLIAALLLHDWPGNIRQLANEVRRVVAVAADGQTLSSLDLAADVTRAWNARPITPAPAAEPQVEVKLGQPLAAAVEELEAKFIAHAMRMCNGRVTEAARLLGVSRKGLFLKRRRQRAAR